MHSDSQPLVLVVNYDVWERTYTADTLASEGYAVVGASNGASALRIAEQHACSAILLDRALPEVTGTEFMQRLKTMDRTRGIPIIVLGEWEASESNAVAGRVPKPLESRRMISELARCLRDASR
jgi:CheY-like chemotaxis protein